MIDGNVHVIHAPCMSVSAIDLRAAAMVVSVHVIDLRHAHAHGHGRECDQSAQLAVSGKEVLYKTRSSSRYYSIPFLSLKWQDK